ncbi:MULTISPECIES: acyltransferase [Sphingobacteriaceae]|uniref:Acetyltransferase n=1 Tax=Sphingobacterium sp. (strain 21) TaxID=743722 RepID=F4C893_SPHS2
MITRLKNYIKRFYDPHEAFIKKLRKQGVKIGEYTQIVDKSRFLYEPWCANLIEIGNEVVIAAGVRLVSHDSSYTNIFGDVPTKYGHIIIEDNVYIGVNAIILPGVRIGESSLIGAGSIVNKNIPPRSIVVGNPCKIIGSIDDGLEKYKRSMSNNSNELVHYIDVGGSYSRILKKHGHQANARIIEKYTKYFNHLKT